MIELDNRIGSGDLAHYFDQWKVSYKLCRLEYGDAAWSGNGPDGVVRVAVEVKKIRDALNSICDGRFAGRQLPGLVEHYQMVWVILEGVFSSDYKTGILLYRRGKRMEPICVGQRQFLYRDLDHWLTTMECKAQVRVRRTVSRMETARVVADLYSWWTGKDWHEHRSHLAFDQGQIDSAILDKPGLVRRVAASLPGVGWTRSQAVARRFANVVEMVLASEEEWK